MKFRVTLKTPDCVEDAILENIKTYDEQQAVKKLTTRWFEYGEYLTVEIDTVARTCTVVEL